MDVDSDPRRVLCVSARTLRPEAVARPRASSPPRHQECAPLAQRGVPLPARVALALVLAIAFAITGTSGHSHSPNHVHGHVASANSPATPPPPAGSTDPAVPAPAVAQGPALGIPASPPNAAHLHHDHGATGSSPVHSHSHSPPPHSPWAHSGADAYAEVVANFEPTHEWQAILPNQAIPPGLEVSLDMSTGERKARIPPGTAYRYGRPPSLDMAADASAAAPLASTPMPTPIVHGYSPTPTSGHASMHALMPTMHHTHDAHDGPLTSPSPQPLPSAATVRSQLESLFDVEGRAPPSKLINSLLALSQPPPTHGVAEDDGFIPRHTPEELRELGQYLQSRLAPSDAQLLERMLEVLRLPRVDAGVALGALEVAEELAHQVDNALDFVRALHGLPAVMAIVSGRCHPPSLLQLSLSPFELGLFNLSFTLGHGESDSHTIEPERASSEQKGDAANANANATLANDESDPPEVLAVRAQSRAVWLLGTLTQNNVPVQNYLLDFGNGGGVVLRVLCRLFRLSTLVLSQWTSVGGMNDSAHWQLGSDSEVEGAVAELRAYRIQGNPTLPLVSAVRDLQSRLLFALTSLVRANAQAQDHLLSLGALDALAHLLEAPVAGRSRSHDHMDVDAHVGADLELAMELRAKKKAVSLVHGLLADAQYNNQAGNASSAALADELCGARWCGVISSMARLLAPVHVTRPQFDGLQTESAGSAGCGEALSSESHVSGVEADADALREEVLRVLALWSSPHDGALTRATACREQLREPSLLSAVSALFSWYEARSLPPHVHPSAPHGNAFASAESGVESGTDDAAEEYMRQLAELAFEVMEGLRAMQVQ